MISAKLMSKKKCFLNLCADKTLHREVGKNNSILINEENAGKTMKQNTFFLVLKLSRRFHTLR